MINGKTRKVFVTVLILTLLVSIPLGSVYGDLNDWSPEMTRFGGQNRYDTSALVSEYLFESSDHIVIARGDVEGNYADALAGSYLAGFRNAPLLLTHPTIFYKSIRDEIVRLGATKAYVLGGGNAVSQGIEDALTDMGLQVERLSGARREDTAVEIVKYVRENRVTGLQNHTDFAFIVNGTATADALVAGSYAYRFGVPILLVSANSLPTSTGLALNDFAFDFLDLVGGESVISADLETLLDGTYSVRQRISGRRRFETSVAFAETMFPGEEHFAFVAGPDINLADGIGAAAFGLPILYVWPDNVLPNALATYLETYMSAFSHLFILGGVGAISEAVAARLVDIQEALPPMITFAYIENSDGDYFVVAEIDNINNTVTLNIDSDKAHEQFTTGYSNLSKAVFVEITNTHNGAYDLPAPGRQVAPDDDFIEIILDLFTDNPPEGVNAQTLLANSGSIFTLTAVDDDTNVRVYTFIVNIQDK